MSTLGSGLKLVTVQDDRVPLVSAVLVIDGGATRDPPGKDGLAHLVEHLVFDRRVAEEVTFENAIRRMGATFGGTTQLDHVQFKLIAPRAQLEVLVGWLTGVLLDPLAGVDEPTFRRVLDTVRSELWERTETHGSARGYGWLQEALFAPGDPYARPVAGTPTSVGGLTLADAQAFVQRWYKPRHATLFLDGDLSSATSAKGMAALLSSELTKPCPPTEEPAQPPPHFAQFAPATPLHVSVQQGRVTTEELWMGWPMPSAFGRNGALTTLIEQMAQLQLTTESLYEDDPDILSVDVAPLEGERASVLVCQARLRHAADAERAAHAIGAHVEALWSTQLPRAASIDQRRNVLRDAARFTEDSLAVRADRWPISAHVTGDPQHFRHALTTLLRDMDPMVVADFMVRNLAVEKARAILVVPSTAGEPVQVGRRDPVTEDAPPEGTPFPSSLGALDRLGGPSPPGVWFRILPNGLTAIAAVNPRMFSETLLLGFHGGTGTERPPGAVEIASVAGVFAVSDMVCGSLDRCGALTYSLSPRPDSTASLYRLAPGLVPHALDVLTQLQEVDWMQWPGGAPARRYLARYRAREQEPEVVGARTLVGALYPGQRWSVMSSADDLVRIDPDVVKSWSRRNRSAANTAVVAVGPLPATAALDAMASAFSSWDKGEKAPSPPTALPPPRATPAQLSISWLGAPQTRITLGCRLPTATPDSAGWQAVFARSMGDALFETVRDGLGSSYGFSAEQKTLRGGASELTLSGLVANASVPAVLELLSELIGGLGDGHWPPTSLDADRWWYFTRRWLASENGPAVAEELFKEWNLGWPIDGGARAMRGLTHVDPSLLNAIARTCHDSAAIVVTGDPSVNQPALARPASPR
ncbi:MAG TPA: insulinase family protein [Polyangia bacterium]